MACQSRLLFICGTVAVAPRRVAPSRFAERLTLVSEGTSGGASNWPIDFSANMDPEPFTPKLSRAWDMRHLSPESPRTALQLYLCDHGPAPAPPLRLIRPWETMTSSRLCTKQRTNAKKQATTHKTTHKVVTHVEKNTPASITMPASCRSDPKYLPPSAPLWPGSQTHMRWGRLTRLAPAPTRAPDTFRRGVP